MKKLILVFVTLVSSWSLQAQTMEMEKNQVAIGIDQFDMLNFHVERLLFGRSTKSIYLKAGWDAGLKLGGLDYGYQFSLGGKWFLKQGKSLTIGVNAAYINQEYENVSRERIGGAVVTGYTFLVKRRVTIFPYLQTGFFRKTEEDKLYASINPFAPVTSFEVLPMFGLDIGVRF